MRLLSPSTKTTYLSGVHKNIPSDAKPISEQQFLDLIANAPPGCSIGQSPEGEWILNAAIGPSQAELISATHALKIEGINTACEAEITAGFSSDALGTPHQYSSQLADQLNLTGAILRGFDMPYACRDEQGVKAFRLHTAAQLRQVGDAFTLYRLQLLQHANELKQQLDLALAAGDAEAMELISWEAVQP